MSLLSVYVAPDGASALVGVDSEAVLPDGTMAVEVSKLAVLPHYPLVVAVRGVVGLLPLVFLTCATSPLDLDDLLDYLPTACPDIVRHLDDWKARGIILADAPLDKLEFAVVGYSQKQKRIIARAYTQEDRTVGFVAEDITRFMITDDGSLSRLPEPSTREKMITVARAQIRLFEDTCPASSGGGHLILATVRQQGVNVEHVCKLIRVRPRSQPVGVAA